MNNLQVNNEEVRLQKEPEIQDFNALLALFHGKSDSICRLFEKEIVVEVSDLKRLNELMIEKLSLHNINNITTSLDITFSNKKIVSFTTWKDFEDYDFEIVNSTTKSVFMQWDFMALINGYRIPQRHTVCVRISSTPNPSDFFKVLLSGGFDEAHDFDIQSCTMICKVDFINNTLAEELVGVAERWNESCECAYSKKGLIRPFLAKNRNSFAHVSEFSITLLLTLGVGVIAKLGVLRGMLRVTCESLMYIAFLLIPTTMLVKNIARSGGKRIYEVFGNLMDIHIFAISKGDNKENERIEKGSAYLKELFSFILNVVLSILISIVFFVLD